MHIFKNESKLRCLELSGLMQHQEFMGVKPGAYKPALLFCIDLWVPSCCQSPTEGCVGSRGSAAHSATRARIVKRTHIKAGMVHMQFKHTGGKKSGNKCSFLSNVTLIFCFVGADNRFLWKIGFFIFFPHSRCSKCFSFSFPPLCQSGSVVFQTLYWGTLGLLQMLSRGSLLAVGMSRRSSCKKDCPAICSRGMGSLDDRLVPWQHTGRPSNLVRSPVCVESQF